MKELGKIDSFKDRIKNKMDDSPVYKGSEDLLWSKVIDNIEENEAKEKSVIIKIHPYIWYASAALVMVSLFIGMLYWKEKQDTGVVATSKQHQKESSQIIENKKTEISVINSPTVDKKISAESDVNINNNKSTELTTQIASEDKISEYDLPDGSHLTLNKLASVEVKPNFKKERSLSMQGEVYFEIEPDKTHPFNIYFGNHRLLVVGTKFNVRNIKEEIYKEISVTEGIVKVFPNNQGKGIEVKAGEQLKINPEGLTESVKTDSYSFIFWKVGILEFKNSTMEDVAVLMSRRYNQKINIAHSISKCTFTGDFTQLHLDEAIQILKITTSYKVEKRKDEIYISGEGCK
ncbi:FecR family protein [Sporocytophaga myxococcoides]|uniref:FecR family protein n=1 Tax=Sporocytophaga myxococcoides TaxID=153721 RepID=UPI000429BE82|nr:FecR domain-containing protein [Sporocytophaga myxococcoides]